MPRIRRDDTVQVLTGKDRGKRGQVRRVLPKAERVIVQGVNLRYKHLRRSQKNPQGGRVQKESPLHASKVQLVDPKTNRPTRVGFRIDGGRKVRYAKRSGEAV